MDVNFFQRRVDDLNKVNAAFPSLITNAFKVALISRSNFHEINEFTLDSPEISQEGDVIKVKSPSLAIGYGDLKADFSLQKPSNLNGGYSVVPFHGSKPVQAVALPKKQGQEIEQFNSASSSSSSSGLPVSNLGGNKKEFAFNTIKFVISDLFLKQM